MPPYSTRTVVNGPCYAEVSGNSSKSVSYSANGLPKSYKRMFACRVKFKILSGDESIVAQAINTLLTNSCSKRSVQVSLFFRVYYHHFRDQFSKLLLVNRRDHWEISRLQLKDKRLFQQHHVKHNISERPTHTFHGGLHAFFYFWAPVV